jgi:hypothetical protein
LGGEAGVFVVGAACGGFDGGGAGGATPTITVVTLPSGAI